MVTAAVVAAVPDIALVFAVRRRWLDREHPVIRAHAWLHQSPWGFVVAACLGWGSHLIADRLTTHNVRPGVRAKRGWKW
jgi:divalent metal cation (Fe/Co/Zn/Cd) transporter